MTMSSSGLLASDHSDRPDGTRATNRRACQQRVGAAARGQGRLWMHAPLSAGVRRQESFMTQQFPNFHIESIERAVPRPRLTGRPSSQTFGSHKWIDDGWIGYLRYGTRLVPGRWRAAGDAWQFTLRRAADLEALEGVSEVEALDGYWGERAELVLSEDLTWGPAEWRKAADHDHCAICWATISIPENQHHFRASDGSRVCSACYHGYVRVRSLGFITAA